VPRDAKSRMRRTETPKPILIKFCVVVDIPVIVTYRNFGDHRLRGFWVAEGQISLFPIGFHRRPTTFSHYRASVWSMCSISLSCTNAFNTWKTNQLYSKFSSKFSIPFSLRLVSADSELLKRESARVFVQCWHPHAPPTTPSVFDGQFLLGRLRASCSMLLTSQSPHRDCEWVSVDSAADRCRRLQMGHCLTASSP